MTQENAQVRLSILRQQSDFTIDETVEGCQIALALGDRTQVGKFQKIYRERLYRLFDDILWNISDPESLTQFQKYFTHWKSLFTGDDRYIYVAILFKQKDQIQEFPRLLELLNETNCVNEINDELLSKSIDELKQMYFEAVTYTKTDRLLKDLTMYATQSNDLTVARKVFAEIPEYYESLQDTLISYMFPMIADQNRDEARDLLHEISSKYMIQELKYNLAKKVYKDDPQLADFLISQIAYAYYYGLEAHMAVEAENEKEVRSIFHFINGELETEKINQEIYNDGLKFIIETIADAYPMMAKEFLEELDPAFGYKQNLLGKVTKSFFIKGDFEHALKCFNELDVLFQFFALVEAIQETNNPHILYHIYKIVEVLPHSNSVFYLYILLHRKIPIPFERMYAYASHTMPYHMSFNDPQMLYETYEEYFA